MATMAGEEPYCGEYQQADDEINCTTAGLPATLDQPNSLGSILNLTIFFTLNLLCPR